MTEHEYLTKRHNFMMSSAPVEVKEAAIAKLDAEYLVTEAAETALEDYHASKPDLDDVE